MPQAVWVRGTRGGGQTPQPRAQWEGRGGVGLTHHLFPCQPLGEGQWQLQWVPGPATATQRSCVSWKKEAKLICPPRLLTSKPQTCSTCWTSPHGNQDSPWTHVGTTTAVTMHSLGFSQVTWNPYSSPFYWPENSSEVGSNLPKRTPWEAMPGLHCRSSCIQRPSSFHAAGNSHEATDIWSASPWWALPPHHCVLVLKCPWLFTARFLLTPHVTTSSVPPPDSRAESVYQPQPCLSDDDNCWAEPLGRNDQFPCPALQLDWATSQAHTTFSAEVCGQEGHTAFSSSPSQPLAPPPPFCTLTNPTEICQIIRQT